MTLDKEPRKWNGSRIKVQWTSKSDQDYWADLLLGDKLNKEFMQKGTRFEEGTILGKNKGSDISYIIRYDFLVKYKKEIDTEWDPEVIENLTGARKVKWEFI
jgi:hypothetical protein